LQVLEVDCEKDGGRSSAHVDPGLTRQVPTFWSTGRINYDAGIGVFAVRERFEGRRKNSAKLHKKLNDKLLEVAELKSRLVPQREKIADLEETLKAKKAYVDELEAKSIEREDLLGKIEADKDQRAKELSEKDKELNDSAAKLAQALEENEKLKKQIEELDLSSANVLTSGFGAALEQFACAYPDLDLSQFSICHEVVDGKIVPSD